LTESNVDEKVKERVRQVGILILQTVHHVVLRSESACLLWETVKEFLFTSVYKFLREITHQCSYCLRCSFAHEYVVDVRLRWSTWVDFGVRNCLRSTEPPTGKNHRKICSISSRTGRTSWNSNC